MNCGHMLLCTIFGAGFLNCHHTILIRTCHKQISSEMAKGKICLRKCNSKLWHLSVSNPPDARWHEIRDQNQSCNVHACPKCQKDKKIPAHCLQHHLVISSNFEAYCIRFIIQRIRRHSPTVGKINFEAKESSPLKSEYFVSLIFDRQPINYSYHIDFVGLIVGYFRLDTSLLRLTSA